MPDNLQFTLSLSALLQGLLILAMGIVGFFIRREIVKMDEGRRLQTESNRQLYKMMDDLKSQRMECYKMFATKDSIEECFKRINHHDSVISELKGIVKAKLTSYKDDSDA